MARFTREEIVGRLRAVRAADGVLFDAFCGSGITAKMAARGGADMVTTHILAFFRMQGLSTMAGYLPIGDANAITLELGERYLANVVPDCPVMAGILCGDPTRDMRRFVHTLAEGGFDGIMNCPTVALIDGQYRKDLEETGLIMLINDSWKINSSGESIWLVGLDDPHYYRTDDSERACQGIPDLLR